MSYETDRIQALERLVCDQAQQLGQFRLSQVEDSAQHSLEVRLLTEDRDEARDLVAKGVECIKLAVAKAEQFERERDGFRVALRRVVDAVKYQSGIGSTVDEAEELLNTANTVRTGTGTAAGPGYGGGTCSGGNPQ